MWMSLAERAAIVTGVDSTEELHFLTSQKRRRLAAAIGGIRLERVPLEELNELLALLSCSREADARLARAQLMQILNA